MRYVSALGRFDRWGLRPAYALRRTLAGVQPQPAQVLARSALQPAPGKLRIAASMQEGPIRPGR